MPLLSIIIPSYNRATLVDQTLHSLARQSNTDFQTILVDHGSTDNTEEIYQKYRDQLQITYYKIERHAYSAGEPRDFGVRQAETPLILFLDSGTIVPSWYVTAHFDFHRLHPGYIGVGLQYRNDDIGEFALWENIDLALPEFKEAQFIDEREGIDLEEAGMPWLQGWTANLSLPREAYFSAGGFDLDLRGWGFEDVDLCYRVFKQGLKMAFVEEGWSLEVPQPRENIESRMANDQENSRQCYSKQQGLGLEVVCLNAMLLRSALHKYTSQLSITDREALRARIKEKIRTAKPHASREDLFFYLTALGQEIATWPAIPAEMHTQFTGPTLLVGGTPQDAEWCDYVTLLDDRKISTPSLWSCCGVLIPLPDQALETVVVSDVWKKLGWSILYPFGVQSKSLLEVLISEIGRAAKQAIFIHSSSVSGASVETLENLCHAYQLSYRIVQVDEQQENRPQLLVSGKMA
jgi:hypothetical protein